KTTSPVVLPFAPMDRPWKTVPSSRASTAGVVTEASQMSVVSDTHAEGEMGLGPIPLEKFHRVLRDSSLREWEGRWKGEFARCPAHPASNNARVLYRRAIVPPARLRVRTRDDRWRDASTRFARPILQTSPCDRRRRRRRETRKTRSHLCASARSRHGD